MRVQTEDEEKIEKKEGEGGQRVIKKENKKKKRTVFEHLQWRWARRLHPSPLQIGHPIGPPHRRESYETC
jgi:hypothetical protein